MDFKNLAIKGSFVILATATMGAVSILLHDKHNFFPEELESARCKALFADQMLHAEIASIENAIDKKLQTLPEFDKIDSLENICSQSYSYNAYRTEQKIDSLYRRVSSIRNEAIADSISKSAIVTERLQNFETAEAKLDSLNNVKHISDSINNQPIAQRFINNWKKIICKQK
jgi:hypothetical protein